MTDYYKHLGRVQNHPSIEPIIDIMTITGFMNNAQKIVHLRRYAEQTNDIEALAFCDHS